MKNCLILLLATVLVSCFRDPVVLSDTRLVNLTITETITPTSVTHTQPIVSNVKMTAPDLCYKFSQFIVVQENPFHYNINATGTYPNNPSGCPTAIYTKDTTLSIPTSMTGKYILRFYNGIQLFKADTVNVN